MTGCGTPVASGRASDSDAPWLVASSLHLVGGKAAVTNDVLLWLDVETTGLDPFTDHLLEIAIQPTALDRELTPLEEPFARTLGIPPSLRLRDIAPDVLEMHSRNGLWRDCRQSGLTPEGLARHIEGIATKWNLDSYATVALAGRSVHFDRAWLTSVLGEREIAALHLSHRHFDLTSIKTFATVAGVEFKVSEDAHRAELDVQEDIRLARRMLGRRGR